MTRGQLVARVALAFWLSTLVSGTIRRIPAWKSDQSLWSSVVAASGSPERVPVRAWVGVGDLEQATRASVRPRLRQPFGRGARPAPTTVNQNTSPREESK